MEVSSELCYFRRDVLVGRIDLPEILHVCIYALNVVSSMIGDISCTTAGGEFCEAECRLYCFCLSEGFECQRVGSSAEYRRIEEEVGVTPDVFEASVEVGLWFLSFVVYSVDFFAGFGLTYPLEIFYREIRSLFLTIDGQLYAVVTGEKDFFFSRSGFGISCSCVLFGRGNGIRQTGVSVYVLKIPYWISSNGFCSLSGGFLHIYIAIVSYLIRSCLEIFYGYGPSTRDEHSGTREDRVKGG